METISYIQGYNQQGERRRKGSLLCISLVQSLVHIYILSIYIQTHCRLHKTTSILMKVKNVFFQNLILLHHILFLAYNFDIYIIKYSSRNNGEVLINSDFRNKVLPKIININFSGLTDLKTNTQLEIIGCLSNLQSPKPLVIRKKYLSIGHSQSRVKDVANVAEMGNQFS